jgi:hypothetical protein
MNTEVEFQHITVQAFVDRFEASSPIFSGVLGEVRELSKKKPEATMSASKVKIVNRILGDLLVILKDEPEGKYLELLDDEALPQMSDAVLTMVQFESALKAYSHRYHQRINGNFYWITQEFLGQLNEDEGEENDE